MASLQLFSFMSLEREEQHQYLVHESKVDYLLLQTNDALREWYAVEYC